MRVSNWILIVLIGWSLSCKKDKDDTVNPFDDPSLKAPPVNNDTINLEVGSFAYLHNQIFKPTCANSGCHDGNFEPDFRTISSSYNTLVLQDVIQNDDAGTYTHRVIPGDADASFIIVRLTTFEPPNASGMMPLSLEPNSDWKARRDEYIGYIKDWINEGAKDPYGNPPREGNPEPQVIGLLAFESGTVVNPLQKVGGNSSPIGVPNDRAVDLWFALEDDKTTPNNLKINELKLSYALTDFSGAQVKNLEVVSSAIMGQDFEGNQASFTHKATVNFPTDTIGSFIYLRTYFQDEDHTEITEVPNDGSSELIKTRFTLQVDSL